MNLTKSAFILTIFLLVFFNTHAQNWDEIIKVVASDRGAGDDFGRSVSISGDYAIVGAHLEDEDASGGVSLGSAGSAYVFFNNGGTWTQVQKLVASDRGAGAQFGATVSISGDYAIIGARFDEKDSTGTVIYSRAGAAYIFHNIAGVWTEVQKIVASDRDNDDWFGSAISISGDYALVGAYREEEDATGGSPLTRAGSAYMFYNNGGNWTQVQKLVASDRDDRDGFGFSVSISGDYAIIGAYGESEDSSGGATLNEAGSAYVFYNNSGVWSEVQKLVASDRSLNDRFGISVAISGNDAIIGAYWQDNNVTGGDSLFDAGSAYIFSNNAGVWSEVQKLVASDRETDDNFGWSVSIAGNYSMVGTYLEDQDTASMTFLSESGSAYLFYNNNGIWSEIQKLTASDRDSLDQFAWSLAISEEYAIIGATGEDQDASGGATLSDAGSAYIFENSILSTFSSDFTPSVKFSLYPNPVQEKLYLLYPENLEIDEISIMDIRGTLIREIKKSDIVDGIDTSVLPPGLYLLIVRGEGISERIKFSKIK